MEEVKENISNGEEGSMRKCRRFDVKWLEMVWDRGRVMHVTIDPAPACNFMNQAMLGVVVRSECRKVLL